MPTVSRQGQPVTERLSSFVRRELAADPDRLRAFARTLVGLLLSITTVLIFKPANSFWIVAFTLLVSSPAVGNSEQDALRRILATLVGGAAAALVVIMAYDLPWLYVLLQAATLGLTFVLSATSLGPATLTGGLAFAAITGASPAGGPASLIGLAWDRLAQAAAGSSLGVLAQRTLWPSDPLSELRRSLMTQLAELQAFLGGRPTALDAGRVARHFELLEHVEGRVPAFARRQAEISLLILEVAHLVDRALQGTFTQDSQHDASELRGQADALLRRCERGTPFAEPPPPPPAPTSPPRWPGLLSESMRLTRRAGMKTALAALFTLAILEATQLPLAGGLFACLLVGQQMTTGTDVSKPLIILCGLLLAMGITLVVARLAVPNVDDLGSYLVVVALALTPTTWAFVAGLRVRTPGLLGTVLVSVGLFGSYGATTDLEPATRFLASVAVGCLVLTAIDQAIWPVRGTQLIARRLLVMMRAAADLMGELDPRTVLAPGRPTRWIANRSLRLVINLRREHQPAPNTPEFARDERTVRLALETQRLIALRVEQASRELSGEVRLEDTAEQRRIWATALSARADRLEREGEVRGGSLLDAPLAF